jgi:hypothetical protein
MLRLLFSSLVLVLPALAGCGPGVDPVLQEPCAQRGPASVIVGTGSDDYIDPMGSVLIETGPQGGHHIWMSLSCQGLGPRVAASYGVRDVATGDVISESPLAAAVDLDYDGDTGRDQAGGIYGYLLDYTDEIPPDNPANGELVGREVVLWADVTDDCHTLPVHAETKAKIAGYDN